MKQMRAVAIVVLASGLSAMAALGVAQGAAGPLTLEKRLVSPASGQANVGELITYQISLANTSTNRTVVSLMLSDNYQPNLMEFVSAEPAPSSSTPGQGLLQWDDLTQNLGDLGPGQTFTVAITFRAINSSSVAPAPNTATAAGIDDLKNRLVPPPSTVWVEIVQSCGVDPYEPNDQINAAPLISVGEEIRAFLCPENDVDFFALSLSKPGSYVVSLFDLPEDYNLMLLNMQGEVLYESLNQGTEPERIQFGVESAGRYAIQVFSAGAVSYTIPYKLLVTQPNIEEGGDAGGVGEPGGTFVLKGDGLMPGSPKMPNMAHIYFDKVTRENLLGSASILPNGRLRAAVKLPSGKTGPHTLVTQITSAVGDVISEHDTNVEMNIIPGTFSLWIDDAWQRDPAMDMPVVNKLIPTQYHWFGNTQVDVNCNFAPLVYSGGSVKFRVKVQSDKFGPPKKVFVRDGFAGGETTISYTNLGGGQYEATLTAPGALKDKHVVFRFEIPHTLSIGSAYITGEVRNVNDALILKIVSARRVALYKGYSTYIFLNRSTLFRDFNESEVADLLSELFIHSQNYKLFGPHDRRATIYYVDRYRSESYVTDWNNQTVDYTSETKANKTASAIWIFMQDVFSQSLSATPYYIMIVGNDEQFPFYRMDDPYNEERNWAGYHGGNPTMRAAVNDFYLTDSFYAYSIFNPISGSWKDGNTELVIGRIIGDGAQDMKEFYLRGILRNGGTGRSVMASVDGWELGYEPDDNRSGEIKDHLNVPARLAARGFGVFNDAESPRTIDKMSPYPTNWITGFRNAANAGMDIFFIGGHNGYTGASLPGDGFNPSDTPSKYARFDDDNPIVMIVGCHGGLPVPNIGSWPGGANNSMVYDVIRSGARAYYGASGYSYGSPGNLHACLWGELLLQYDFDVLTQSPYSSHSLGYAVRYGKINYPFGIGSNNALDRKTVTEFNLFGVPWQMLRYPGSGGGGAAGAGGAAGRSARVKPDVAPGTARERAILLSPRRVSLVNADIYQQTFHVSVPSWSQKPLDLFDSIEIPGGEQQYVNNAPVLPAITPFSIALPTGGEILSIAVDGLTTTPIGTFNIPTAQIGAWTVSGINLTADSDIDYYYPGRLVEACEGSRRHYLMKVFPVRHNPTTDDTVLHDDFNVIVTYRAPVPYGILNFAVNDALLGPAQTPTFSADVFNMGAASVSLTGRLAIIDEATSTVVDFRDLAMTLAPGTVFPLLISASGPPGVGQYSARLSVWATSGGPVATAEDAFSVTEAFLSNLVAVYDAMTRQASLSVQAESLLAKDGTLALAFALSEEGSLPLDVVYVDPVMLPGGGTVTVPGVWTADAGTSGTRMVEAVATLDGAQLNSVKATFTVFTPQSLLEAIIDHILERHLLNEAERQTADLNHDGRIDSGDVILAVKEIEGQ
ncbi:MAG: hypothetical protein Kow0059_20020 [Candidatus Sumerlaeia bacterium]